MESALRRRGVPGTCLRVSLMVLLVACGGHGATEPDPIEEPGMPIPSAGPHFSVLPVPLGTIARITPIGYNNEVFPTPHTYWDTCEFWAQLPSSRPCHRERQPLRAPGGGRVRDVDARADGTVVVEGPPGLIWHFGHVTPAAGLGIGDTIAAGDVVATMYYEHGFDFGVLNYGVTHEFVDSTRYNRGYRRAEHPIAQYPAGIRPELVGRIQALSKPLGRIAFDVAGTASGGWFVQGAPPGDAPLRFGNEHMLLWLARWVERRDTRIAVVGERWPGMVNQTLVVDPAAPSWEELTPASGVVALRIVVSQLRGERQPRLARGHPADPGARRRGVAGGVVRRA